MYNFEQIGFIPRSIIRTLKRFFKQISLKTDLFVIYEFRVSRYIAIASLQCFFFLIICPWTFQFFVKFIFLNTFLKNPTIPTDVFINIHQQERAFSQIQTFSQKIYFETLLESFDFVRVADPTALEVKVRPADQDSTNPMDQRPFFFKVPPSSHRRIRSLNSENGRELLAPKVRPLGIRSADPNPEQRPISRTFDFNEQIGVPWGSFAEKPLFLGFGNQRTQKIYQSYFLKCANFYHQQSLSIITNWIIDLVTLLFFFVLLILLTPQILILKTFCIESLLSLSETTKCFFLIFFLDLLVGFHSSKSWEIFLQFFIEHFGLQIHSNFIAFFISTFPVLLDTIFKYWIFRYLNKISPSTVATYQAMIE